MRAFFAVLAFVCAAGLPVDAFAQAGTELGRARIQSLKEMHKPYDVKDGSILADWWASRNQCRRV